MPVRYVNEDGVPLYTEAGGGEELHRLSRGDRVDLDGSLAPLDGRHKVTHGEFQGWVQSTRLAGSGMGLVASARRAGTSLPEQPTPHRPTPPGVVPVAAADGPVAGSAEPVAPVSGRTPPPVQASSRLERRDEVQVLGGFFLRTLLWTLAFAALVQIVLSSMDLPIEQAIIVAGILWVVMQVLVLIVPRRRRIPRRRS